MRPGTMKNCSRPRTPNAKNAKYFLFRYFCSSKSNNLAFIQFFLVFSPLCRRATIDIFTSDRFPYYSGSFQRELFVIQGLFFFFFFIDFDFLIFWIFDFLNFLFLNLSIFILYFFGKYSNGSFHVLTIHLILKSSKVYHTVFCTFAQSEEYL